MRQIILILLLSTAACERETWSLRECRTTSGEAFEYQQSSLEPRAEEHQYFVNRYGVYDVDGWWRKEEIILTCRSKPEVR